MALSAVPSLIDALVTLFGTTLPTFKVSDGYSLSDDPTQFVLVGVEDWLSQSQAGSVDSTITQSAYGAGVTGGPREERGEIVCSIYTLNGAGDQGAARDALYAALDALQTAVGADLSLGTTTGSMTVQATLGGRVQLLQNKTADGAECAAVFTVQFYAYHA